MLDGLEKSETCFVTFGCVPFTNEITGWETFPNEPMFVHCSTKVLRILTDMRLDPTEIFVGASPVEARQHYENLRAGLFYNELTFDQAVYIKNENVKPVLLNGDARIVPVKRFLDHEFEREYFVKPSTDLKAFKGGLIQPGYTLRQFLYEDGMVDAHLESFIKNNEPIVIARPQEVKREYRFFVVHGEVITGSQYMFDGHVLYSDIVPAPVQFTANEYARLYQPASVFTMDLCTLANGEIKIVEYNCVNCSGVYHTDIAKFAKALRV